MKNHPTHHGVLWVIVIPKNLLGPSRKLLWACHHPPQNAGEWYGVLILIMVMFALLASPLKIKHHFFLASPT